MGNSKYTIDDCHRVALEKGGKYLSSTYLGYNEKAEWECSKGHKWLQSFHMVHKNRKKGTWCPYCHNKQPKGYGIDHFQTYAKEHNGKCLTIEYNGRKSRLKFQCQCGYVWETTPTSILNSKTWCPKCANILRKVRKNCKNCGKECHNPNDQYCSSKCKLDYQYTQYIQDWLNKKVNGNSSNENVSRYIIRYLKTRSNNRCERCGWSEINPFTQKVPLQLHHKDGNWKNSYEENLEYICPNCHSLTENYGGANRGNGREERRKKYQK